MVRKKEKILVVDDEEGVLRLVEIALRREGYEVISTTTGEDGVQMVRTGRPDLVLMDIMMPGIDGYEAVKRIRRLPNGRQIPIVFLSALGQMDEKIRGLRIGGNDYVTKPVHLGELLARVEALLRTESPALSQVITLFGSRSGVGVTTLAVNLTVALRNISQKSVLLIDWQRPLGDVTLFLGIRERKVLDRLLPRGDEVDERVFATALREYLPEVWVLPGATDPASASRMDRKALSRVLEMALVRADYVLVDTGAFFSWEDPPLVSSGDGISLCILTPEITSVRRAAGVLGAIDTSATDLWLLLNRNSMSEGIPRDQVELFVGASIDECIPEESDQLTRAMNEGRPLILTDPRSAFSRAIVNIATRLHESLAQ